MVKYLLRFCFWNEFIGDRLRVEIVSTIKDRQRRYLMEYEGVCRSTQVDMLRLIVLINMRSVGNSCPELLAEHQQLFEEYRQYPSLKDACDAALDVISGRRFAYM